MKRNVVIFFCLLTGIIACSSPEGTKKEPISKQTLEEESGQEFKEEENDKSEIVDVKAESKFKNSVEKINWFEANLPVLVPPLYFEFDDQGVDLFKKEDPTRYFDKHYTNILNYELYNADISTIELYVLGQIKAPEGTNILIIYAHAKDTVEHIEDYEEIFFQPFANGHIVGKAQMIVDDSRYITENGFLNKDFELIKDYSSEYECIVQRYTTFQWVNNNFEQKDEVEIMSCPYEDYITYEEFSDSVENVLNLMLDQGKYINQEQIENIKLENFEFTDSLRSTRFVYELK